MCGISVLVSVRNEPVAEAQIRSITDKVSHRGPDDAGYFIDSNVALGHRRLSIIDLSQAGHQPMQRGDLWIAFNGEIYNYIELRQDLLDLGHTFSSGSDTEVILHAYKQWGTEAFAKFNGMWAFALYDQSKKEIIFCRDHFGIKPLYFFQDADWFMAGSEIKQFTAVDSFKPVLNKKVAVNFLARGWLNVSDETFFEGVNELRPGHFMVYNAVNHTSRIVKWYNLDASSKPITDTYETAVANVRQLFIDSVHIRMRSDVRVGSCLSGGIDSSSIVTVIHSQKMANPDFTTVTSCYKDKVYDEQIFSDLVTAQTGFHTSKIYPELDHLLDEGHLDRMLYHQDQPFSRASHYSEFCVFQKARENKMIVMQDGQGSDEFLCGYPEFMTARMKELLNPSDLKELSSLIRAKASHRKISYWSELRGVVKSLYSERLIKTAKSLLGRSETPWFSDEWKKLAQNGLDEFGSGNVRDLSIEEISYSSIPYQLHSQDRNSMLFSIESRLPFLDHRLVEYCISLPSEYKIRMGYTKAVLRDAITELPKPIRERKDKMGFVAPDSVWMKTNSKKLRKDLEEAVSNTGIFSDELLKRFDRFVEGSLGYELIYFRAMTLNRFCKIFNMKVK